MKLTKTDQHEQALPMDKETMFLVREACAAMLENTRYPVGIRDRALQLKRMLEDPDNKDCPALFQKSHGAIIQCTECNGTGKSRLIQEDRNEDVKYSLCPTCEGTGQLYEEYIRKCYVPTEYHRRKLAK